MGGVFQVDICNRDQRDGIVKLVAQSFAGTAKTSPEGAMDWILGPKLKSQWEDPRRGRLMAWFMGMMDQAVMEVMGGFELGVRLENGDLAAAVVVTPRPHGLPGLGGK